MCQWPSSVAIRSLFQLCCTGRTHALFGLHNSTQQNQVDGSDHGLDRPIPLIDVLGSHGIETAQLDASIPAPLPLQLYFPARHGHVHRSLVSFHTSAPVPLSHPTVTAADRSAVLRVIAHSYMFHNAIGTPWHEPVTNYHPLAALFFDHAMAVHDNYTFVIIDTLPNTPPNNTNNGHTEHDSDWVQLGDTDLAGVVLCYEASRVADLDVLRTHPTLQQSQVSHDLFVLLDDLYQHDLRADPYHPLHSRYQPTLPGAQPTAPPPGDTIECFLLATKCQYRGERLASYLCRAVYCLGQQRGYRCLETVATHPATAHIFVSSGGVRSVVTHRIKPSGLAVRRKDGSEWYPWADVKDDMVAVHVPIRPAGQEQ